MIGELSLGGEVRPVPGILPLTAALGRRGVERVIVAVDAVEEARLAGGIDVVGVATLHDAADAVRTRPRRRPLTTPPRIELATSASTVGDTPIGRAADGATGDGPSVPDLAEVRGQL